MKATLNSNFSCVSITLNDRVSMNFRKGYNMNPLSLLEKAINEHGSATILKERSKLVKEMLEKVENENSELKAKLATAEDKITELMQKVPNNAFVEYRGVKFKRKPSGGFENTAYCISCEAGMASTSSGTQPFVCGKCSGFSGFKANELSSVISEVSEEYHE